MPRKVLWTFKRLLWLFALRALRICLIFLLCREYITQGRQPIWSLYPVPSVIFPVLLWGLVNYWRVNKEEKLSALPTHLVMVEQGQDKHRENSTGKRKGWETYSNLWSTDSEILLSKHSKGFLTWRWKKFLAWPWLCLQRGISLISVPHGPGLSFWEVVSQPLPFMLTSDTDFGECAFSGSVCSFHCPFLPEGCVKTFPNQPSLNQPHDFFVNSTKILIVFNLFINFQ